MNKKYWAIAVLLILIILLSFTCSKKSGFLNCKSQPPVQLSPTPVSQILLPTVKPANTVKKTSEPIKPVNMPTEPVKISMPIVPISAPTSRIQVSTVAGSGSVGTANGIGTAASFNNPAGIAVDASGNLYVADSNNDLIRKITADGVVTTLAGSAGVTGAVNGTGTAASFWHPWGIAVDSSGNVYVADQLNAVIRKITTDGVVTTLAGSAGVYGSADGIGTVASFFQPAGIAVDSTGSVYVADSGNNIIRKITSDGVVTTLAGSEKVTGSTNGTRDAASFNSPEGVALDTYGNLYVTDSVNDLIRKITPLGVVTTLAGSAGVAGSANGIRAVASFNTPFGIAVDNSGNVYVADQVNNLIRKISSDGAVKTFAGTGAAGSANGDGTSASFNSPFGIAVDGSGTVYIADTTNQLIRKISQ
jgi:sugar lactone lactonase YvrE